MLSVTTTDDKLSNNLMNELSNHVKSNSKTGILSCLSRIRNDNKCYKQFDKDGGFVVLVELLRYQNIRILNVSLSILANACLVSKTRYQIRGTKIVPRIMCLIKNIALDNVLQCRAWRLVANLSECDFHAKSLCQAGALDALKILFDCKIDVQTRTMAIRATRNIWISYETSRESIIEMNLIRIISNVLIDAETKEESKYLDLSKACLKAINAFLTTCDPRCADQMRGENDAQGFKSILKLCERNNKIAQECLSRLCQIAECRPILGNSDAIVWCVTTLKSIQNFQEIPKTVLSCLCLFCREAVNRAKIKYAGGLELILDLLKNEETEKYHPMLLHALTQFVYDDSSITIMVKNGLLGVLITKLKYMVSVAPQIEKIEDTIINRKRINETSPPKIMNNKFNRTCIGRFSLDYHREDWSPGSATSVSSSPPSTPPLSMYNFTTTDDSTEDNYSPVCSDTEWPETEEEPHDDADTEDSLDSHKSSRQSSIEWSHVYTLILLNRLSNFNDPIENLADPGMIKTLSNYIRRTRNNRACKILKRIVGTRFYLLPLLKQGFVFEVESLYESEQYMRQLCAWAEADGAVGELITILLRGEDLQKLTIAVSIPFLIKSRRFLRQLLHDHNGLQLIFDVFDNRTDPFYEKAILAVCELANNLNISSDLLNEDDNKNYYHRPRRNVAFHESESTLVTFELDDGTTIDACRRTLCERSEVFAAMLEGNFVEKGKRRVKLKNTTKQGLDTLLLAVNDYNFDNRTIESLLDAVLLADKFLMNEIAEFLTDCSIGKLNYDNYSRAWLWARKNSCNQLKISCVKIFLTAKLTRNERIKAFNDFESSNEFNEFLNDIKDLIKTVICQR